MFRTEIRAGILLAGLVSALPAQHLRHGVWSAELVVVARVTSVRPIGKELIFHKLQPLRTLKGEAPESITIVESKKVSDRPKPVLGEPRIYCLKSAPNDELPAQHQPYYRMLGFKGDHPVVTLDATPKDSHIDLTEKLVASEAGQLSPRDCCRELLRIALRGTGKARTEAIEVLREREITRGEIIELQKSALLARAVAETDDVEFKSALASLCTELEIPGVIEALCLSLESKPDKQFALTLGRLTRFRHGEESVEVLRPQIVKARQAEVRDTLLLALGATKTKGALEALLNYRQVNGGGEAIDAALRAHGKPRALEAIAKKKRPGEHPTDKK